MAGATAMVEWYNNEEYFIIFLFLIWDIVNNNAGAKRKSLRFVYKFPFTAELC